MPGQRLLELEGSAAALVAVERTALNLAMRLSGIATATAVLVAELAGTGVQLADTRKTTPGLRVLEKYAVRCGGGVNHRMGLDDAAMLKENHLAWSGGVGPAVVAVRRDAPWPARVIVEAETAAEALAAVEEAAQAFDTFNLDLMYALPGQTLAQLDADPAGVERDERVAARRGVDAAEANGRHTADHRATSGRDPQRLERIPRGERATVFHSGLLLVDLFQQGHRVDERNGLAKNDQVVLASWCANPLA